jgi:chromosome segregation ATPase
MSSEDWRERMERQMAFIVEQQAQSEVRWGKADERWAQGDERWARTEESIRALLTIAEIHERKIDKLSEVGLATDQKLRELHAAGRATDERLNALINVVERQISKGRNGKS